MTANTARLAEGAEIGEWVRETGFGTWTRFAAVNDEFVPIHMDDEAGRAAGMPGAFGQGNLLVSYLHAAVREWMGEAGTLVELSAQFRKPNLKGTIRAGGTITSLHRTDAGLEAHLDLWVKDADDAVLAPATATVRFT
jgi:acyl dehydratase